MKYLSLIFVCFLFACQNESEKQSDNTESKKETLFCTNESGDDAGFKNAKGEIVIPVGKYSKIWTQKFKDFAIVFDEKNTKGKVVAIDQTEKVLFEVYMFDNYPDEASEGLFRVKQNEKVGFANEKGEIVIPCKYACAFPFENGKAKVAVECKEISDGEHTSCESENWIFIDKEGKTK